jgi:hypothetical protein
MCQSVSGVSEPGGASDTPFASNLEALISLSPNLGSANLVAEISALSLTVRDRKPTSRNLGPLSVCIYSEMS